jgi:hypothetical protein
MVEIASKDMHHRVIPEKLIDARQISKKDVWELANPDNDTSYPYWMLNPQNSKKRPTILDILDSYFGDNNGHKHKRLFQG